MNTCIIRYGTISPSLVFNWLSPKNVTAWNNLKSYQSRWWDEDVIELRNRFGEVWMSIFDELTSHFTELEKSVLNEGITHPIKLLTGRPRGPDMVTQMPTNTLPPNLQATPHKALVTHQHGGSRVWVATKHNLDIPCVIYDFDNQFTSFKEINVAELKELFGNHYTPHKYASGMPSMSIRTMKHLQGSKHANFGSHKVAQQQATKKAKEILNVN